MTTVATAIMIVGTILMLIAMFDLIYSVKRGDSDSSQRGFFLVVGVITLVLGAAIRLIPTPTHEPLTYEYEAASYRLFVYDKESDTTTYKYDKVADSVKSISSGGLFAADTYYDVTIDGEVVTLTQFVQYLENKGYHARE